MFYALLSLAEPGQSVEWYLPVPNSDTAPAYPTHVSAIPFSGKAILARLRDCDAFVVCGGTSFHDQYRGKQHRRHVKTLIKFVGLSLFSRLFGTPVYLMGIGVGPYHKHV